MKVKYIGEGTLRSNGVTFSKNEWVVVNKTIFNYLKRTYPNSFEFDEEIKQKVAEPEEVKESKKSLKKKVFKKVE